MKEKVYDIWYDLHLTGHMFIEQKDKNYIVTLEPEKEIPWFLNLYYNCYWI